MVAAVGGRNWRVYAGPAAFLLAATIAVALIRSQLHGNSHTAAPLKPPVTRATATHRPAAHRLYVVRAGDTIEAISVKLHVPQSRILALNPKVTPTALFIGEKLRLR
ncbi:MAG TPA: LysM domain-containing protein [Gaiellaceae bacterium]|nr:LysM domain-containing protein [Gaiellaceae bacterium]